MYDAEFIRHEEELLGKFVRQILKEFHDNEKESRIRYCKEHGQSCENCSIECEVRTNGL